MATGEAELRDGDYFGTVLNRAARVMAAGHGGQILVAESTAGLLSGVDLLRSGAATVAGRAEPGRGVPGPGARPAYGVSAVAGARRDSGKPAACDHELDRPRVRGRRGAKRRCKAHRLVTLTGVGGVGKTRLAFEVAARLADEFADGVWVFELAAVTDPAAVPDAVAAVLGITQQPGKTVSESVAAALEGRVRLLVFDNCEHVLDAAADLVEAILAAVGDGEDSGHQPRRAWVSPTSRCGRCHRWMSAGDRLCRGELFVERAQSVAPRFSLAAAMRRARWWRSAAASTGSRWPSSWRPRGWRR